MKMKKKLFNMKTVFLALLFVGSMLAGEAFAQQRQLTGKVIDDFGDPIAGASIVVVGTTTGTATLGNGTFSLNVPPNATLSVSFIGFVTQTIAVGDRTNIDITLLEDALLVEEVVVIGYGVQRKSDLTGAVSQIKATDLENRSVATVGEALQGKVAGLQIITESGAPGAGTVINVRGFTAGGGGPLYIVDGLQVANINYLDPENIQSLEVLKDAASAAIYGVQAGNGVILVTTKSGSNSVRGRVFYNMMYSSSEVTRLPSVMNAQQWTTYMLEGGFAVQDVIDDYWYTYNNGTRADTKWSDYIFEKGYLMRNTVGVESGTDKGNLYVALTSTSNDGVVSGNKDFYRRFTGQVNADYQVKTWLKVGTTNSVEKFDRRSIRENSEVNGLISAAVLLDPITPYLYEPNNIPAFVQTALDQGRPVIKDENGGIYGISRYGTSQIWHPMQMRDSREGNSDGINANGTLYANFTPVNGLVFTSRLGYRYNYENSITYVYPYWVMETNAQAAGTLDGYSRNGMFYQWENFANYMFNVGKNNITAMAGMSYQKNKTNGLTGTSNLLTNEEPNYRYFEYTSDAATTRRTRGAPTESISLSYFGRLNWNYGNRYNAQINFRADAYDAASLPKDNRWGYFPSFSAGWTISNESFMSEMNRDILSLLKIRASWGKNGNINIVRNGYYYSATLSTGTIYDWSNSSGSVVGTAPSTTLANPTLRWEESVQLDVGLDTRFLNDRLTLNYDFYRKMTEGQLTSMTPVMTTGASRTYVNAGSIRNYGHELELSWKDNIGKFNYSISANMTTVNNKVVKGATTERLAGANLQGFGAITYQEEGFPLWYMRTYKFVQVDPGTGDALYEKADGSLCTYSDLTDDDKMYVGSAIPDYNYGITISLAYNGFDFTAFGSGQQGGDIFQAYYRVDLPRVNRVDYFYTDRWTPSNTNAAVPKPNMADTRYWGSSAMISSASFFKIRQIQLGYNIPRPFLNQISVSSLRLYVSLDNFFTFTSYNGFDPETRSGSTTTPGSGMGIDRMSFPLSKNITFGLNLSL